MDVTHSTVVEFVDGVGPHRLGVQERAVEYRVHDRVDDVGIPPAVRPGALDQSVPGSPTRT